VSINPSAAPGASLTARESELLDLLCAGYPSKRVRARMQITHHTYFQYLAQAKVKLGADTTHQLIAIYATRGTI